MTPHGVVLRLAVPGRAPHRPGQHYVVRLTAEDGYTAQRSYSVTSPTSDAELELYVEALPEGEVSGYLTGVAEPGDTFEVRGPIGGWFVWDADRPALAVGGGSGVAPLVAMLRHAREAGRADVLALVVAARTYADLPYADELEAAGATLALSREDSPAGRLAARVGSADLGPRLVPDQVVLVCGSAGFAEAASQQLVGLGVDPEAIRVERFGPTG